jgi:protein SCO1/2
VGSYVAAFHPRFVGLTGTPEQVDAAAKAYRVYFRKASLKDTEGKETGEYTVEHSGIIFLMDPDGRYLTHFSTGTTPADMAAYIRREATK